MTFGLREAIEYAIQRLESDDANSEADVGCAMLLRQELELEESGIDERIRRRELNEYKTLTLAAEAVYHELRIRCG